MSSTKRVTGDYNIHADEVVVYGNLRVIGSSANVYTSNSEVFDNTITLNAGETGNGVTAGTSGLEVDRGLEFNASWLFDENNDYWAGRINGALLNIRAAEPIDNSDVVTKGYLSSYGGVAAGSNYNIQFNNVGVLDADPDFSYFYNNGNVQIGNTLVSNLAIVSTFANNDLILDAAGTGTTFIRDTVKLSFQTGTTPTNVANTVQVLANTPGQGGTGLYVVNSSYSDELVSKRKATWLGLVFS